MLALSQTWQPFPAICSRC